MTAPERPGPERPGPDYPPEWDLEPSECGNRSETIPGFGWLTCELRPGHDGPHREREDGLEWDDDDHDQRHQWWHPTCDDCVDRANRIEEQRA
jgi:hypothetical protein